MADFATCLLWVAFHITWCFYFCLWGDDCLEGPEFLLLCRWDFLGRGSRGYRITDSILVASQLNVGLTYSAVIFWVLVKTGARPKRCQNRCKTQPLPFLCSFPSCQLATGPSRHRHTPTHIAKDAFQREGVRSAHLEPPPQPKSNPGEGYTVGFHLASRLTKLYTQNHKPKCTVQAQ